MLTRGMATEWGTHNIQVNGIGPGYFITEMTQALADNPEFDRWLCGRTPAGYVHMGPRGCRRLPAFD